MSDTATAADEFDGLPLFGAPDAPELTAYEQCTPRQRKFVDLMLLRGTGAVAYREAGYNAKDDSGAYKGAYQLLGNTLVKRAMRERQDMATMALGVNVINVCREFLLVARSDLRHYEFTVGPEGVKLAKGAPDDAMRAVQSVTRKVRREPPRKDEDGHMVPGAVTVEVQIKLHPKVPALTELSKRLALFDASALGGVQLLPQVLALEDPTLEPPPEADESGKAGAV